MKPGDAGQLKQTNVFRFILDDKSDRGSRTDHLTPVLDDIWFQL